MNQLAAICDSPENARRVHWQLKGLFDIQCLSPDELGAAQPPGRYTIVAVNLDDLERVRGIRHWLTQKPKDAKVIFVTDQGSGSIGCVRVPSAQRILCSRRSMPRRF
jgi:hypothetical protein